MTDPSHPRFGRLLSGEQVDRVDQLFSEAMAQTFGDRLAFGFVCGGFSKGYATDTHDVDVFVCVKTLDPGQVSAFRTRYLELHRRLDLPPDENDPGEVVELAELRERIGYLAERSMRLTIETYYEYEAIVWVDMLQSPKIARVGDLGLLLDVERSCQSMPQRWRKEILSLVDPAEHEALWTLPLSLLCERCVRYLKG